jgi:hypothetical protein
MTAILFIILTFIAIVAVFMQQAEFGKTPSGKRLELIKQSPHFKKEKFENLSYTPDLT